MENNTDKRKIDNKYRIEEYKELRQEIRLCLSERNPIKYFAYTLTIALVGFFLAEKEAIEYYLKIYLLIGAGSLILVLWHQENRRVEAVFRIAAYIKYFIEDYIDGLNWETSGIEHSFDNKPPSLMSRFTANLDFIIIFFIIYIYSLFILLDNFFCNITTWILMGATGIIFVFFLMLFLNTFNIAFKKKKEIRSEWKIIRDNFIEEGQLDPLPKKNNQ